MWHPVKTRVNSSKTLVEVFSIETSRIQIPLAQHLNYLKKKKKKDSSKLLRPGLVHKCSAFIASVSQDVICFNCCSCSNLVPSFNYISCGDTCISSTHRCINGFKSLAYNVYIQCVHLCGEYSIKLFWKMYLLQIPPYSFSS